MWPFKSRPLVPDSLPTPDYAVQILDALTSLNEQVNKLTRWSYRSQKTESELLQSLQEQISGIRHDQGLETLKLQTQLNHLSRDLIEWLDDLDALLQSRSTGSSLDPLLRRWSDRLLTRLEEVGFRECLVKGKPFDPRVAEALGTTDTWTGGEPPGAYQVVSVLRRGFLQHGELYRKAQVIVYNGIREDS